MSDYSQYLYQAQEGKHERWRFRLMIVIMFVGGFIVKIPLQYLLVDGMGFDGILPGLFQSRMLENVVAASLLVLLIKPLHGRSPSTLFNSFKEFRWQRLMIAMGVAAILVFVLSALTIYVMHGKSLIWAWEDEKSAVNMLGSLIYVPINIFSFVLIFNGYILQEISIRKNKPIVAARYTFLWLFIVSNYFIISWLTSFDFDFPWRWVINGGLVVNFLLILLVVLDDGLELALGYRLGTVLFPLLVNQYELQNAIAGKESSFMDGNQLFFEGYVYFFSVDWGVILLFLLFFIIIRRRFNLLPLSTLQTPLPPWQPEAFDLIDEIGKPKK